MNKSCYIALGCVSLLGDMCNNFSFISITKKVFSIRLSNNIFDVFSGTRFLTTNKVLNEGMMREKDTQKRNSVSLGL